MPSTMRLRTFCHASDAARMTALGRECEFAFLKSRRWLEIRQPAGARENNRLGADHPCYISVPTGHLLPLPSRTRQSAAFGVSEHNTRADWRGYAPHGETMSANEKEPRSGRQRWEKG
jgi:hypothetical protein